MNQTFRLVVFVWLPLFLIGCSDHVSLSGRVTYSDDGTPLETGTVFFEAETFQARGPIGADGKYTLATHRPGDGLPPGRYKVYVGGASRYDTRSDGSITQVMLITYDYAGPDTLGLVVDVDRSTRTFDFQVDRAPGSRSP